MNRPVRDPYAGWCERFSDRLPAYRLPTRLGLVALYFSHRLNLKNCMHFQSIFHIYELKLYQSDNHQ